MKPISGALLMVLAAAFAGRIAASNETIQIAIDASTFVGPTTASRVAAACASLRGSNGFVSVPGGMDGGLPDDIPEGCTILDLRGKGIVNVDGVFSSGYANHILIHSHHTQPVAQHLSTLVLSNEAFAGGMNADGNKRTYSVLSLFGINRTPGQHIMASGKNFSYTDGDTIGSEFQAQSAGNSSITNGDEGVAAYRGTSAQINTVFTAVVTSVAGSTVHYSQALNEGSRGENRDLIVTNRGQYRAGRVERVSGAPPEVKGTGTSWSALCPHGTTPCSPAGLFFELAGSNSAGANRYVFKIRTINDDATMLLDFKTNGSDHGWVGDTASGSYEILAGATVSRLANNGGLDVDLPAVFRAGDSILMPLGHSIQISGARLVVSQEFPDLGISQGLAIVNTNRKRRLSQAFAISGPFATGMNFTSAPAGALVKVASGHSAAPLFQIGDDMDNAQVGLWRIRRNGSTGSASASYLKASDTWDYGALHWSGLPSEPAVSIGSVIPTPGQMLTLTAPNATYSGITLDLRQNRMICYNAAKTICDFVGTGAPEGSVAAAVGSTYRRVDGGVGTAFCIKEAGSAATGWECK